MIVGVGTDIIEIDRIESALNKTKHSFLKRVFTLKEIEYFKQMNYNLNTIAGGFAAKESVMKSLGTGLRGFRLLDIEILRDQLGKPYTILYNDALELANNKGIRIIHVSISHCKTYATAYAIAESDERGDFYDGCHREANERN